jgi:hypothetical protein
MPDGFAVDPISYPRIAFLARQGWRLEASAAIVPIVVDADSREVSCG